jgi:hypothetical protein
MWSVSPTPQRCAYSLHDILMKWIHHKRDDWAHPPSERLNSSSAAAARDAIFPSFDIKHALRGRSFCAGDRYRQLMGWMAP